MLHKQDFLGVGLFCAERVDSNSSSGYLGEKRLKLKRSSEQQNRNLASTSKQHRQPCSEWRFYL